MDIGSSAQSPNCRIDRMTLSLIESEFGKVFRTEHFVVMELYVHNLAKSLFLGQLRRTDWFGEKRAPSPKLGTVGFVPTWEYRRRRSVGGG
jgi:hypothetical protein